MLEVTACQTSMLGVGDLSCCGADSFYIVYSPELGVGDLPCCRADSFSLWITLGFRLVPLGVVNSCSLPFNSENKVIFNYFILTKKCFKQC